MKNKRWYIEQRMNWKCTIKPRTEVLPNPAKYSLDIARPFYKEQSGYHCKVLTAISLHPLRKCRPPHPAPPPAVNAVGPDTCSWLIGGLGVNFS
jgi:hypothetical protein